MFQSVAESKAVDCLLFSYRDILDGKFSLKEIASQSGILRIESPGENEMVREAFIRRGMLESEIEIPSELDIRYGEIKYGKYWYLGFSAFLDELQVNLDEFGENLQVLNSPKAIQLMFHKWECQEVLKAAKVSVPSLLGKFESLENLLSLMETHDASAVFVKPLHGSSASGVLAFRATKAQQDKARKMVAKTSVLLQEDKDDRGAFRLMNSLRLSKYFSSKVLKVLIDRLAVDGLYAERWLPKERAESGVYDLRVLVINGRARHVVARESESPITNLHLGNKRGNLEQIRQALGAEVWKSICAIAEDAVAAIDGAFYAGVDVLVRSNQHDVFVLEVNAFGDLLPKLLHEGENCYEAIIEAALLEFGNTPN